MGCLRRRLPEFAIALLATACGAKSHVVIVGDGGQGDADADLDASGPTVMEGNCGDGTSLPPTLACTGLYLDIGSKQLSDTVRVFAPGVALWSDGAEKERWIALPAGTQVDARDPSQWVFPVGTKAWKEFRVDGRRVETRLFHKVREDRWLRGAYVWNDDESAADFSFGGDIALADGSTYHVPTQTECDECHKGRRDRLLGFEMISLSVEGASGVTLSTLVEERLLSPEPPTTRLSIPDDGTGAARPALSWLHINCGVSCHNDNPNATGYGTGLRLRLSPQALLEDPPSTWDPLATTMNVRAITPKWLSYQRIAPGEPDESLIVRLIGARGEGEQMPPIASSKVDEQALAWVRAWIASMPHGPSGDSGTPEAGAFDAGGPTDAAALDGGFDAGDASKADGAAELEAGSDDSSVAGGDASAGNGATTSP